MKPHLHYIKYQLLILLLGLSGTDAFSQQVKPKAPDHSYLVSTKASPEGQEMKLTATVSPALADMKFSPKLIAATSPNHSRDMSELLAAKRQAAIEKKQSIGVGIEGNDVENDRSVSFDLGTGFYGDIDGGCPNDNTIAVSSNRIISMMNGNVGIYNKSGSKINIYSLEAFFGNNINSPCDPKVEYDAIQDRYFMFVQACGQAKDNVAMAFSETSDPNGSWNTYVFPSDALGDGSWSDYPKVAITTDEVFVSLNLFAQTGDGAYRGSIVYQMDKHDGYSGNSLSYKIWEGFNSTTLIVRSGTHQYGPGAYLITGSAFEGDKIVLSDITGNLDSNAELKQYDVPVDYFSIPAAANQRGTDYTLDTGDCRIQDGYYQDGTIHFVYSVSDVGWGAYRYHRLDPVTLNGNNYTLTSASGEKDYSYPSISPFTTDGTDQTAIVHFAASGRDIFPEIRAKVFNDDFSSENSAQVRQGTGPIYDDCYDSNRETNRWGDYTGIAYDYTTTLPTVWIAGSIAGADVNVWWTWIHELTANGVSTPTLDIDKENFTAYPNPSIDYLSVNIEVTTKVSTTFQLTDATGRHISTLYKGVMHAGENTFTFDTSSLRPGIYYLNLINNNNEIIKSEKIVVSN